MLDVDRWRLEDRGWRFAGLCLLPQPPRCCLQQPHGKQTQSHHPTPSSLHFPSLTSQPPDYLSFHSRGIESPAGDAPHLQKTSPHPTSPLQLVPIPVGTQRGAAPPPNPQTIQLQLGAENGCGRGSICTHAPLPQPRWLLPSSSGQPGHKPCPKTTPDASREPRPHPGSPSTAEPRPPPLLTGLPPPPARAPLPPCRHFAACAAFSPAGLRRVR